MIVEEDGIKWVRRPDTDDYLTSSRHEPELWGLIKERLDGRAFLDVGAHAGKYALRAAPFSSWVYAVEPNPVMSDILEEEVELNDVHNLTILRHAAWDTYRTLSLDNTDGGNAQGKVGLKGIPVMGAPLDLLLAKRQPIGMVKIDVEGAEGKVLAGAHRTLKEDQPLLFIEMHDRSHQRPEILEEVSRELGRLGYTSEDVYDYSISHYWFCRPR